MAGLENQYVDESFKDVVQLEQSGAGQPSGVGASRLYDGDGNIINARSARLNPYDVCPIAATANAGSPFAETNEWLTDMNQTALESDGWTFNNTVTAEVKNGVLYIHIGNAFSWGWTGAGISVLAWRTVSLSGDFCIDLLDPLTQWDDTQATTANVLSPPTFAPTRYGVRSIGIGVADTVTTDTWYATGARKEGSTVISHKEVVGETYNGVGFDGSYTATNSGYVNLLKQRVARYDGTLGLGQGSAYADLISSNDGEPMVRGQMGWDDSVTAAVASTFDKLVLITTYSAQNKYCAFGPIRRYL
jgi:hypothetical protein